MSVEIKTPTRHMFEHSEFQFGEKTSSTQKIAEDIIARSERNRQIFNRERSSTWGGGITRGRKRRASERGDYRHYHAVTRKKLCRSWTRHRIILPTKFLLGGNITDPLNLNSMCDDEVNRALNEKAQSFSPIPLPISRPKPEQQVRLIIPANLSDPLNLNSNEDDVNLISPRTKRKRHRHKKKLGSEEMVDEEVERARIAERKFLDKIVSPAIPQDLPFKRKKRTSSEGKSDHEEDKISPHRPQKIKFHRQSSGTTSQHSTSGTVAKILKPKVKTKKVHFYEYGNYMNYYEQRSFGNLNDKRVQSLNKEWFDGSDVLDIGCNAGNVTLMIARDFNPKSILGIDIDDELVKLARKNVRNYLHKELPASKRFPDSMSRLYGPLLGPPVGLRTRKRNRPTMNNVSFLQVGNLSTTCTQ